MTLSAALRPETAGTVTPMMEQFIEIKTANPDSLLFYRMGDFYELFFEDAVTAARALGIALTKRGKHLGEDIPMCGVPVHAADDYLQKLIALGHRVAVCEQIEDPAEARKRGSKSVVRRDVVRLVTPGTITEEKLLDASQSCFLMTLARVRGAGEGQFGLAWIDISTGAFRVAETSPERLLSDIMRVDPRELVVAEPVFHDPELRPLLDRIGLPVTPQPQAFFESVSARERIGRFFGVSTTDGLGRFTRPELSAIGAAIAYVERTQKDSRPQLERPRREEASDTVFIDAATRGHLELLRTMTGSREGSLLAAIDRTMTPAGTRLLAERLTAPLTVPDRIERRLDAVSYFRAESALRGEVRGTLKSAPDLARSLARIALGRGGPRDFGQVRLGMDAAASIAALLERDDLPVEIADARAAIGAMPRALAARLRETLSDELPLLKRDGGFVRHGHDDELDELRALARESRQVIARMEAEIAAETGIKSLKIRHNNVLGYYIEVTQNHHAALTGTDAARARFIHRQTMASAMRFTTVELSGLETRIANAADRALSIELAIHDALVQAVTDAAELLRAGAAALAAIDVAAALAELAEAEGHARPRVDGSLAFRIVGGRHPVVEQALRRQAAEPFVANDCDLSAAGTGEAGCIWLLTGPNMGGKSTFLRQNALIALMAQAGCHVPAREAHIGVVDRLFSRVGASDDLARGRSTFMVEMVETAAILNQAGERALVILDEIGRGTATFDGLSIAWATVEHLHETNRCRAIFATHFHELTALSARLGRLVNVTMRVKEWNGDVIFLHEVATGAADRSYGVQVARLAGLPESVVERARDVLRMLEAGDQGGRTASLVDDLPLFSAAARKEPIRRKSPETDRLQAALEALHPDEMTPREALEALYTLKGVAREAE